MSEGKSDFLSDQIGNKYSNVNSKKFQNEIFVSISNFWIIGMYRKFQNRFYLKILMNILWISYILQDFENFYVFTIRYFIGIL